jgi:hypothetical protein
MELSNITAWLASDQPFAPGAALYQAAGPSSIYKQLFALGETAYSRQVLARELSTMVQMVQEEVAAITPPEPPAAAVPAPPPAPPGPDSPLLVDVRQQLRAVRDERSQIHAQMTAPNLGKKARYGIASRILALTDLELELKATEAHILAHGRLPGPVATADVTDTGELRRRLLNLRSQRTKLQKLPARANDLAAVLAEIDLIQLKLTPTHD